MPGLAWPASAWSPNALTRWPHPSSKALPQRPGAASGSGSRSLRRNAICMVSCASEVWGSLGMAWSQAAACGPAWERTSARRAGGREGQQHVVAEEKVPSARRTVLPPVPPFTGLGQSLQVGRADELLAPQVPNQAHPSSLRPRAATGRRSRPEAHRPTC